MIRGLFFGLAIGCVASNASAMPLIPPGAIVHSDKVMNVKIVCEQDGRCYQRGRRPVARWVYGEGNFDRPYVGPGYYGWPGHRWVWWPFLGY